MSLQKEILIVAYRYWKTILKYLNYLEWISIGENISILKTFQLMFVLQLHAILNLIISFSWLTTKPKFACAEISLRNKITTDKACNIILIYYNNDFWQKDTPSFSTADHVTNNVTINNIYPNKNFTHTFLSSSPANTLKDWDKGCLPHRKICQPHASCRKTTRSKQQIENRPLFRKYQMLSNMKAQNSTSDIFFPSVSVFDARY